MKRLLDLFCCAGGAAMGYHDAGFEVIGVDINPQPNYPFRFIQADALAFLDRMIAGGTWEWVGPGLFAAVHASPPCQGYSTKTKDKGRHPRLITDVRERLIALGKPYVIENVDGAKGELIDPVRMCGSSFGLRVRRHRWFEANWPIEGSRCDHGWQDADKRFRLYDHGRWFDSGIVHVFGTGGGKGAEHWAEAMGIDWMNRAELAEAIPPAYTEDIGTQMMTYIWEGGPQPVSVGNPNYVEER